MTYIVCYNDTNKTFEQLKAAKNFVTSKGLQRWSISKVIAASDPTIERVLDEAFAQVFRDAV